MNGTPIVGAPQSEKRDKKPIVLAVIVVIIVLTAFVYLYNPIFIKNVINSLKSSSTPSSVSMNFSRDNTTYQILQTSSALYSSAQNFTEIYSGDLSSNTLHNGSYTNITTSPNVSISKHGLLSRLYISMPLSGINDLAHILFSSLFGQANHNSSNKTAQNGTVYFLTFSNDTGFVSCSNFPMLTALLNDGASTGNSLCQYIKEQPSGSLIQLISNSILGYTAVFESRGSNQLSDTISILGNYTYGNRTCTLIHTSISQSYSIGSGSAYLCFSQRLGLPVFLNMSVSPGGQNTTFQISLNSSTGGIPNVLQITKLPSNATFS